MRIITVLLLASSVAAAEERHPENAISLQVPSIFAAGVAGEYERAVWTKFSLVAALGLRAAADDDFDSRTLALGGEARVWVRQDWEKAGPYVGARLDVARTDLRDTQLGRDIGASWAIAETLRAGWRFTIARRVEITPSAGFGVRHELAEDGGLAAWTRPTIDVGLTVGALF